MSLSMRLFAGSAPTAYVISYNLRRIVLNCPNSQFPREEIDILRPGEFPKFCSVEALRPPAAQNALLEYLFTSIYVIHKTVDPP